jgi:hypothetical protein
MGTTNESYVTRLKRRLNLLSQYVYINYIWFLPSDKIWLNSAGHNDFNKFLDIIVSKTARDMVNEFRLVGNDINQITEIRKEIEPYIKKYILKNHIDKLRNHYDKIFKDK